MLQDTVSDQAILDIDREIRTLFRDDELMEKEDLSLPRLSHPLPPPMAPCRDLLKVACVAPLQETTSATLFARSLQELVHETVMHSVSPSLYLSPPEIFFSELKKKLPIVYSTPCDTAPCTVTIRLMLQTPNNLANGTGRFFLDNVDRWLLPGASQGIFLSRSIDFYFVMDPSTTYFVHEITARISNSLELSVWQKNFQKLAYEMRLTIKSVLMSRRIASMKSLSPEEQVRQIQKTIESLVDNPQKEFDIHVFDQAQQLFFKLSAERNASKMIEAVIPLLRFSPPLLNRDIFHEIRRFVLLFRDQFQGVRELGHLSRIVCFQYLFNKKIEEDIAEDPTVRHFYFKVAPVSIWQNQKKTPVLAIAIAMNRLSPGEMFEDTQILGGVQELLPQLRGVPGSFVSDLRNDSIRMCYLELQKEGGAPFERKEILIIKKFIDKDLRYRIQSLVNPLFIPRNEEEVLRRVLTLSQELNYVNDLPQVVISFFNQSDQEVMFTIVLLRVGKPTSPSLEALCSKSAIVTFSNWERRFAGYLRKRNAKEAFIFTATTVKKPFLRSDQSLDLNKARQVILMELISAVGEVRDYNGGMIEKQQETLENLKKMLDSLNSTQHFLLENFFYSLQPVVQQSLINPILLKELFSILLSTVETKLGETSKDLHVLTIRDTAPFLMVAIVSSETGARAPLSRLCQDLFSLFGAFYSQVSYFGLDCAAILYTTENSEKRASIVKRVKQFCNR